VDLLLFDLSEGEVMLMDVIVLKGEIETCLRLLGVEKISELGPKHVSIG
jgi:hypothetical protein